VRERRPPRRTPPELLARARTMRRENATEVEKRLWQRLRSRQLGVKFRRQVPVGPYVADFMCFDARLIVELDGGQHGGEQGLVQDERRTRYLEEQGFRVLRFWNNDVTDNLQGVLEVVAAAVADAHLSPKPTSQSET